MYDIQHKQPLQKRLVSVGGGGDEEEKFEKVAQFGGSRKKNKKKGLQLLKMWSRSSKNHKMRSILQTAIPNAQFGGRHAVTMLPGGGIGPELMSYVREIFRYAGVPVDFEIVEIDPNSHGNDDLEYAITSIKRNGVAIKGRKTVAECFFSFLFQRSAK